MMRYFTLTPDAETQLVTVTPLALSHCLFQVHLCCLPPERAFTPVRPVKTFQDVRNPLPRSSPEKFTVHLPRNGQGACLSSRRIASACREQGNMRLTPSHVLIRSSPHRHNRSSLSLLTRAPHRLLILSEGRNSAGVEASEHLRSHLMAAQDDPSSRQGGAIRHSTESHARWESNALDCFYTSSIRLSNSIL